MNNFQKGFIKRAQEYNFSEKAANDLLQNLAQGSQGAAFAPSSSLAPYLQKAVGAVRNMAHGASSGLYNLFNHQPNPAMQSWQNQMPHYNLHPGENDSMQRDITRELPNIISGRQPIQLPTDGGRMMSSYGVA
jgi:hypothetical protein